MTKVPVTPTLKLWSNFFSCIPAYHIDLRGKFWIRGGPRGKRWPKEELQAQTKTCWQAFKDWSLSKEISIALRVIWDAGSTSTYRYLRLAMREMIGWYLLCLLHSWASFVRHVMVIEISLDTSWGPNNGHSAGYPCVSNVVTKIPTSCTRVSRRQCQG